MAVRNIAVTDTIEKFRTEFNAMTLNDFGDIANLDASLTATNLVDAMNETLSVATNTAGFRIEDSTSTQQLIGGGEVMRILGTTNQTTAVVSATDTLTIGLPDDVTIAGNLTVTGTTEGDGNITIGDAATDTVTFNATIQGSLLFEGSTGDSFETTLTPGNTSSDITLTLPSSASDTLVGKATTDTLTNKSMRKPITTLQLIIHMGKGITNKKN